VKSVIKIIDLFGGLPKLIRLGVIKLENEPFMALVIEYVGEGPDGLPLVSVAHYFEQNGDLMSDPEMEFQVDGAGGMHPVSFTQHSLGLYRVARWRDEEGRVMCRPKLAKDLASFARTWDRNLKAQGFLEVATAQTKGSTSTNETG
jgi:hypothetical protein